MAIERLAVIYDADGGLLGELAYVVGKVMGTAHCAACDITHGSVKEKPEWTECKLRLGVEVEQLHRNELDPALAEAVRGKLPCVAALEDGQWSVAVGAEALEGCGGEVGCLEGLLQARAS